jgi:hypothetical protein
LKGSGDKGDELMAASWEHTFRNRMLRFEADRSSRSEEVAVSIKVRVAMGCFHREHSPHAFEIIDRQLLSIPMTDQEFSFEEHESGPELLVYLAMTTAGIALAKSVVDLIITIIKARSESVKKGDRASAPVELIVRRVEKGGELREEMVLRIGHNDPINPQDIEERLKDAAAKLLRTDKDVNG